MSVEFGSTPHLASQMYSVRDPHERFLQQQQHVTLPQYRFHSLPGSVEPCQLGWGTAHVGSVHVESFEVLDTHASLALVARVCGGGSTEHSHWHNSPQRLPIGSVRCVSHSPTAKSLLVSCRRRRRGRARRFSRCIQQLGL